MDQDEIAFGPFRLHLTRRQLDRDGVPIRLGSRALDLLRVLALAKGELVTKNELMAQVWPGSIVCENNIQVQVASLRRTLGDDAAAGPHILTVPGRGYRLAGLGSLRTPAITGETTESQPSPSDMPSIAVLPFLNMTSDPEQGYFADGVVEEIITALSHFAGLFVISRGSSFSYRGSGVDIRQVGRELGARYLLEGSIRRDGKRVRIVGQLIESKTGAQLWADRFDTEGDGIFQLQERLASNVVGAIAPRLEHAEIERAKRKPPGSLDAYDYYLRGLDRFHEWTREGNREALRYFHKAAEIDPSFATAYGMAALCYAQRVMNGGKLERREDVAEAVHLADVAVKLGSHNSVALTSAGIAYSRVVGDVDVGGALIDRALALNKNSSQAWYDHGFVKSCKGEPEAALESIRRVVRLNPLDPLMYMVHTGTSLGHFLARRYDEASACANQAVALNPRFLPALRMAAASYALAGQANKAKTAMARLRKLDPSLRVSHIKSILPLRQAEDSNRYAEGLRIAGLPV